MWAWPAISVLAVVAPAFSCSAKTTRAASRPAPAATGARPNPIALRDPARYVVPEPYGWIERTPEGIDLGIVQGRRVKLRGVDITWMGPAEPEVEQGISVPPWAIGGTDSIRYVFWNENKVYGATHFTGSLLPIGTLKARVIDAFDGLDGTVLWTQAGRFVVHEGTLVDRGAIDPQAVVAAMAAGPKVAASVTVFGHAWLTLDGGQTYQDVSAAVPAAVGFIAKNGRIAARQHGGNEAWLGPVVHEDAAREIEMRRSGTASMPPADFDDHWPEGGALDAAVRSGLVMPDGSVLATGSGFVGRVDVASGRGQLLFEWPQADGECELFQAPETILLLCAGPERSTVRDLEQGSRVERTFPLMEAPAYDRFVGTDGEALGFLGPCDGGPPPLSPADAVPLESPYNVSTQRSPVFCARADRRTWVEHRLDPVDAPDVIAWVARPQGKAVAVIARPGFFLENEKRVEDRGPLRIVRVAGNEPPLSIPPYAGRSAVTLSREMAATPDGGLQGFLPSSFHTSGIAPVRIDARGIVRQSITPPRLFRIAAWGPLALASSQDRRFFQTIDFGHAWTEVEPPSGGLVTIPTSCTAVGCRVGPFIRIGWGLARAKPQRPGDLPPERGSSPQDSVMGNETSERLPDPPLVRLDCHAIAPPEGSRLADSFGFGVTTAPMPRMTMIRIGMLGTMLMTVQSVQRHVPLSGDVEIGWLPPLDLDAPVRRATVPLARLSGISGRFYEARIGYIVDAGGTVRPINTGNLDRCPAPLLDEAGATQTLGGCALDPSVGVLLHDRIVLFHQGAAVQIVTSADLRGVVDPSGRGHAAALPSTAGKPPAFPVTLQEVARRFVSPNAAYFTFGAGIRNGAPAAVAMDGTGRAVLSPIDPERGTFGPEERIAPFGELILATDPRCRHTGAARVVLPLGTEIGLAQGSLPGVFASGTFALAVVRWSRHAACLEAVEISVRDERHENDVSAYEPWGTVRKVIARFEPAGRPSGHLHGHNATLVVVSPGTEIRQRLRCERIVR